MVAQRAHSQVGLLRTLSAASWGPSPTKLLVYAASAVQWDSNGWVVGAPKPLSIDRAFSLFAPEPDSRFEEARWRNQAEKFFRTTVALVTPKRYPDGGWPLVDAAAVDVRPRAGGEPTSVLVVTLPLDRAPELRAAADAGARAIGGAGMDALVARAKRVWQIASVPL